LNEILSIKTWLAFLGKITDVVFPTVLILLFFSWNGIKSAKGRPEFRFFLIFLLLIFASRFMIFFSGVPYQGRYLYPIVIALSIVAAVGFNGLIAFLQRMKRLQNFSSTRITAALIAVIIVVNASKGLYHIADKQWIRDVSAAIGQDSKKGTEKTILISGVDDIRLAYHSGAEFIKFTANPDNRLLPVDKYPKFQLLKMMTGGEAYLLWLPYYNIYSAEDFASEIRSIRAQRVFLFLDEKDRNLQDLFENEKVPFPFKQKAVFKEGKKKTFILYERE